MNVSLSQQMESWIHEKVSSGMYQSASEVVREGLRLLLEREALREERIAELRRDVALGLSQLDEGRAKPFDSFALTDIQKKGRERLQAR